MAQAQTTLEYIYIYIYKYIDDLSSQWGWLFVFTEPLGETLQASLADEHKAQTKHLV